MYIFYLKHKRSLIRASLQGTFRDLSLVPQNVDIFFQSSNMTGNLSSNSTQGGQLESMLGDLQSDLSRQGVNTKTKGLCAACNQPVVGQVIIALPIKRNIFRIIN